MTHHAPHSPEWFKALEAVNPQQAAMTLQVIAIAGRSDVCSVCGDVPAKDYKVLEVHLGQGIEATIRLCDDCRDIRSMMHGESFSSLDGSE